MQGIRVKCRELGSGLHIDLLAVIVPAGTDEEAVLDQCLAASAVIENEMEIYILPRMRVESL